MEFLDILLEKIQKQSGQKTTVPSSSSDSFGPTPGDTSIESLDFDAFAPGYSWLFAQPLMDNPASTEKTRKVKNPYSSKRRVDESSRRETAKGKASNLQESTDEFQKPTRKPHPMNSEQQAAFCFFKAKGVVLHEGFTLAELKSGWRKLAKLTHPDTCKNSRDFQLAQECYQTLISVFSKIPS